MYEVIVRSLDKNVSSGTGSNFNVYIGTDMQNRRVRLKSCVVPLSCYNVNSYNNKVYFTELAGVTTATLTVGMYTASELATLLGNIMTAASPNGRTYTVTYSSSALAFVVTGSAGTFRFLFGSNTSASAWRILGFSGDGVLGVSQTSDWTPLVNYTGVLYVGCSLVSSLYTPNVNAGFPSNILAVVPVTVNLGQVLCYVNDTEDWKEISLFGGGRNIEFVVYDEYMNVVDLRGANTVFVLEFTG